MGIKEATDVVGEQWAQYDEITEEIKQCKGEIKAKKMRIKTLKKTRRKIAKEMRSVLNAV